MLSIKKVLFIFFIILTGCNKNDINSELIILLGDSRFYYINSFELSSVPEFFNLSEIGQTSQRILNSYPVIERLCQNRNCKIIVQVGVNDILNNTSLLDIEDSINKFSILINSINAELKITSIIPVTKSYNTQINRSLNDLDNNIQKSCRLNSCSYINILDNIRDSEGYLKEYLTTDGIHLTAFGRRLLIKNMMENELFN